MLCFSHRTPSGLLAMLNNVYSVLTAIMVGSAAVGGSGWGAYEIYDGLEDRILYVEALSVNTAIDRLVIRLTGYEIRCEELKKCPASLRLTIKKVKRQIRDLEARQAEQVSG